MGRDDVHPLPRGLQSKLLGRSVDWRTPPPPGLNALASYRPSARYRSGSAGPSVGSETMGFIVDGIRPGRTPVRTEILKPVTNQVTTPPGSARRSATRSDTVLLRSAVILCVPRILSTSYEREPGSATGDATDFLGYGWRAYRRAHEIQASQNTITAADPLPDDRRQAIEAITRASWLAH